MKKILITGGSGFIGSHCINLLAKQNYEIHAISRNSEPTINEGNICWYNIDLFDIENVELIFEKVKPTFMIHLAWKMETGLMLDSEENEKWLYLSKKLIKIFHKYGGKRILVSGSGFEYDLSGNTIIEEGDKVMANNSYGKSKNKLHKYLKSFSQQNELSYVWCRIFFVYGPGQKPTSLVPYVLNNLRNNIEVETTDGNQIYDYLYVQDVALALVLLMENTYVGAVNVSSGRPVTLKNIILKIAKMYDNSNLIHFDAKPRPKNSPSFVVGDNTLLKKITNWNEKFDLEEGLKELNEFNYLNNL